MYVFNYLFPTLQYKCNMRWFRLICAVVIQADLDVFEETTRGTQCDDNIVSSTYIAIIVSLNYSKSAVYTEYFPVEAKDSEWFFFHIRPNEIWVYILFTTFTTIKYLIIFRMIDRFCGETFFVSIVLWLPYICLGIFLRRHYFWQLQKNNNKSLSLFAYIAVAYKINLVKLTFVFSWAVCHSAHIQVK